MKILYILDYFYPSTGGVERVFENITNHFSQNHEIIVLTSKFSQNLPSKEFYKNITIYRIGKNRFLFTILGSFFWLKLLKNIDLIHTSTYNAAYVAKFLSFFTKAPVILTSHEIVWKNWYKFKWKIKWFFYKKIEDFIYKFNFFYVFVSQHVRNIAISSYKIKKHKVIYNWLENISFNKINKKDLWFSKNDFLWVFAWRPWWLKWLDFLLENFQEIKKLNPKFKLLLILLEKNNSKKLQKINSYLNKDIKILYEIPHHKIYDYLQLADVGIVPSRSEWFGFTALEFSNLWKTTVLSFVGGIPEINFWDCHFFKPDNKQQFLKAFHEIFNWKKNNYSYNKKLTIEKMNKNYKKIYKKLITN